MVFAKVTLRGGGSYVQPMDELGVLIDEIKEGSVGEHWDVDLIEMSQEDYEKLPEFQGH